MSGPIAYTTKKKVSIDTSRMKVGKEYIVHYSNILAIVEIDKEGLILIKQK